LKRSQCPLIARDETPIHSRGTTIAIDATLSNQGIKAEMLCTVDRVSVN